MTEDRTHLPRAPRAFDGVIGATYADSTPATLTTQSAPEGAPNVVVILLDDVGFGQTSPFGGPARMPHLQALADQGLVYNRFHTTALCSPTRAALLSGRNHHTVHTGTIMELTTAYPGYDGEWPDSAASVARTLTLNGYNTAAFGKWHNVPDHETGPSGPFNRWPTGKGFEYWYGFLGGEADQWNTPLWEGTVPTHKPADEPDWHLNKALADRAITWMGRQRASAPDKPFFLYFAPGAAHAPHHVAPEWSDRYRGEFDDGWDVQRERTFEMQKRMGLIPDDTVLTPRPDEIPSWESRSDDEKRLYARMQEVFAGFLEHTDHEIGRVLTALDDLGITDNTLVMFVVGDNGPSAEGTLTGTLNNMKTQQGFGDDVATMLTHIDEIGGPHFENHYPVGWCWAGSSPFQWMKQVASHFGGTRNGLVVRWPASFDGGGQLRTQFHHIIDLAPTILEAAGVPEPVEVDGVPQTPIEGVPMNYTFDDAAAKSRRITQYFEMFGNRALYHDGWVAGCRHGKLPWQMSGSYSFDDDAWELYNIEDDFSQAHDLAATHPEKLRELQDLFMAEAATHQVLPLDDRFSERADASLRPSSIKGKTTFTYLPGTARIPEAASPPTKNVDHILAAEVVIPEGGAEGVLVCCGGHTSGYSLFVHDGHLVWEHNWFNESRYRVTSAEPLPAGRYTLSAEIVCDEEGTLGTGGTVTLRRDAEEIGSGRFDKQVPFRFTVQESFDVGCDTISPVSELYSSPATFTGELVRVVVESGTDFTELAADEDSRRHRDDVLTRIAIALH